MMGSTRICLSFVLSASLGSLWPGFARRKTKFSKCSAIPLQHLNLFRLTNSELHGHEVHDVHSCIRNKRQSTTINKATSAFEATSTKIRQILVLCWSWRMLAERSQRQSSLYS
uniref:Secreted peptide n=1 Tax=Rhipicephalus pulchellus TaxID=72859 RepID=L7LVK2_RHIPC